MGDVSILGVDLAENVFQLHGAVTNGPAYDEGRCGVTFRTLINQ